MTFKQRMAQAETVAASIEMQTSIGAMTIRALMTEATTAREALRSVSRWTPSPETLERMGLDSSELRRDITTVRAILTDGRRA